VISVHLFGRPAAVDRIQRWCDERGIWLVEDAAQALGARLPPAAVGSLGRAAAFSFFPTKNLGACGDAGAVTTDDGSLAENLRALRQHGRTGEYEHRFIGLNSRLDALQAAVLGVKMKYLDRWNQGRRENAQRYARLFGERDLGAPGSGIILPPADPFGTVHQYVARIERGRDSLRRFLSERGIGCAVYYPLPLHLQPALKGRGRQSGSLEESERACREVLSLPVYPELTPQQQEEVVEAVAVGLQSVKT
jgi:dTDP-4-amino-4,6-dideoxygalactose transaminase